MNLAALMVPFDLQTTFFFDDTINRLEVCIDGHWGSVCGDGENDPNIAKVAYRELDHAADGMYIHLQYSVENA